MRHRVVKYKFASDKDHSKSLFNNLSSELILREKVVTTLARAKALRPHVEKLVTFAVKSTKSTEKLAKFNAVKALNAKLSVEGATKKLLEDIAARYLETKGGYTRIIKTGFRDGDQAEMARIEFTKSAEKKEKKSAKKAVKAEKDEQ